jgi:copper chaperone CopZ
MKIFVFKTNIFKSDQEKIEGIFSQYKGIVKWEIDFESKNNVLQVKGYGVTAQKIIASIKEAGYLCEEIAAGEF